MTQGFLTWKLWSCSRERIWELRPSPAYQQSLCANTPRWDGQLTIRQFSAQVSGLQRARVPCKAGSEERSGRAAPLQTFPSRGEGKERFCRTAWGERQQIQQPGQESTRLLFKKRKKKKEKTNHRTATQASNLLKLPGARASEQMATVSHFHTSCNPARVMCDTEVKPETTGAPNR